LIPVISQVIGPVLYRKRTRIHFCLFLITFVLLLTVLLLNSFIGRNSETLQPNKMKKKSLTLCLLSATFFASAQNIGINNPTPQFPLSFNAATGDKISLWSDGTPTHYGFGIKPALLQIFAKTSVDNIAFGYGSSTAFTQRMRILNSGEYGMELNGRMVLANGTSPLDAAYG